MPRSERSAGTVTIRPATLEDIKQVIQLDNRIYNAPKPDYWNSMFERYASGGEDSYFLVAMKNRDLMGFVIGEVRAWEFGSPPAGWVFIIAVDPRARLNGLGSQLFEAMVDRFRKAGVTTVRTMLARDAHVMMSFFRSQGMMAGQFIELEMDVGQ